jgi:hypothetical protein
MSADRPGITPRPEEWQEALKEALREAFERNVPTQSKGSK